MSTNDSIYETSIHSVTSFPFDTVFAEMSTVDVKDEEYITNFFMTFDIETTSINQDDYHEAFMYTWQATIKHVTILGRTWTEFDIFLKEIQRYIKQRILVVYCHNLSFEFQFLRSLYEVNSVFATEPRKILRARIADNFEFRCSYRLTNMGLARFLQQSQRVPEEFKKGQNFDYSKIRTPNTILSQEELLYCRNDVAGLYIAIEELLESEDDDLTTIPMTSTGYVRREAREVMLSKPYNKTVIDAITPTAEVYIMCKEAARGGNCHCNPLYSNSIVPNLWSEDMSSAYPGAMMQCKFPMKAFYLTDDPIHNLNPNKAYLLELELYDVELSTIDTIPYIAYAKCKHTLEARKDNGRVLRARYLHLFCTDIDWKIISKQYKYSHVDVVTMYASDYDYLPDDYRKYIFGRYIRKCELKFGDPYYYAKEKNKINSLFGMMLTDIVHSKIIYTGDAEMPYFTELPNIHEALQKVEHSKFNFLAYQWGLWVTAHCRARLQKAIDACAEHHIPPVYCDTDSVKCMVSPGKEKEFEEIFKKLNIEILAETAASGFNTTYVTHGQTFNLGLWEDDGRYSQFKSLGAKKYYTISVDGRQEITVAGLSKKLGLEYLTEHLDGINSFKPGTLIPAGHSGRTSSHYIDVDGPRYININGETILTGSGVAIQNTSYQFSLSDDYEALLSSPDIVTAKPIF